MSERRIKEIERDIVNHYALQVRGTPSWTEARKLLAEYKAELVKQDELDKAKIWCWDKGYLLTCYCGCFYKITRRHAHDYITEEFNTPDEAILNAFREGNK